MNGLLNSLKTRKLTLLYIVSGIALIALYWGGKNILIGDLRWEVSISNIMVNMILVFGVFGFYGGRIADRIWWLIRKGTRPKRCPIWFSAVVTILLVVGLVYYMTLWGLETRW